MTSFVQEIPVDSDRHKFAMTQNAQKRCCWYCYIELVDLLLPITLLLQWRVVVYEETFGVNITIAQTCQIFEI